MAGGYPRREHRQSGSRHRPEDDGRNLLKYISDDEENWPSRLLERSELQRLLADAIEKMPRNERIVISLYYHEELTLREIAKIVNLHESRVSQLKSQAILRLRSYMEKRWPLERGAVEMPDEMTHNAGLAGRRIARGQFTRVLESMTGESPASLSRRRTHRQPSSSPARTSRCGGNSPSAWTADAALWIGAGTTSWEDIGSRVLQSAGVEDEDRETVQSTYLEILSQALSGVARRISARARQEVSCADGRQARPPDSASGLRSYSFEIGIGDERLSRSWRSQPGSLPALPKTPASSRAAQAAEPNPAPQPRELAPHPIRSTSCWMSNCPSAFLSDGRSFRSRMSSN